MNKVLAGKIEQVEDFARRGFERLGLELLGVMPVQKKLAEQALLTTTDRTPHVNLPQVTFYTNSQAENAKQVIEQLWGNQAKVTLF
jgi:hypothetical protein